MLEHNIEKIDFHVHPFLENYEVGVIVEAMQKNEIGMLGLPNYNNIDNFIQIRQESEKLKEEYFVESDSIAVKIKNYDEEKYLLRATELECEGNFQLVIIGNTEGLDPRASVQENIETGLNNNSIVVIDHPFADAKSIHKGITKEKIKFLEQLVKTYEDNISWEWNSYCIPWIRLPIGIAYTLTKGHSCYDVNHRLERFANEEIEKGRKVNIVADSDVHARVKWLLNEAGRAHIRVEKEKIDYGSGQKIISSLNCCIKQKEGIGYLNHKDYVSVFHLVSGLIIPLTLKHLKARG